MTLNRRRSWLVVTLLALAAASVVSACGRRSRGTGVITTDMGTPTDSGLGRDGGAPGDASMTGDLRLSRTPALAITDDDTAGVSDIGAVAGSGCIIAGISLHVDITHTCDGDLAVDLTAPNGTNVAVYGGLSTCSDTVPFDVDSTSAGEVPFTLASLVGTAGNGTWVLRVVDATAADTGTLNAWSLDITCE